MYRERSYTGACLPAKTLCLTYDDGPGKDTLEIAEFLHDQNIKATFFVVGKYAVDKTDVLEKVSALGHLIGNHTYEHPDMPYYLSKGGDVINQVLRTDPIIKNYVDNRIIFFRSPYGKWSKEVADELNLNLLATINHIGPIHWDVGGIDCFFWKNGKTVEETVQRYMTDITKVNKGIVVMHDEIADMEYLKKENQTLELTKKLIPLLKAEGYRFVRLDEIDSIRKDVNRHLRFTLKTRDGKFVFLSGDQSNTVMIGPCKNNDLNELSIEDLGKGKFALLSFNGLYFSVNVNDGCSIKATSKEAGEFESFDLIPIAANRIVLRAYNGNYLVRENRSGNKLLASAMYMRGAEIFSYCPVNVFAKTGETSQKRLKLFIRQSLYLKSKLQQKFF